MGGESNAFNFSTSRTDPKSISPFGPMPFNAARTFASQFSKPLAFGFGIGDPTNKGYENFLSRLPQDQGPLASYIQQGRSFLPGVFGQAQKIGSDIATRAPGLFNQFQGQISSLLNELPNFQREAGIQSGEAGAQYGHANEAVNQAFSPISQQALFQNAQRSILEQDRSSAAGRGLLDAGSQQAREEGITRDLASNFAQNQFQNQQAALQGAQAALGGQQQTLGTQLQLQGAGVDPAFQAFGALAPYAQALSAQFGIPLEALGSVFQMLSGNLAPTSQILGQTAPSVGQKGRSFSFGGSQSANIA